MSLRLVVSRVRLVVLRICCVRGWVLDSGVLVCLWSLARLGSVEKIGYMLVKVILCESWKVCFVVLSVRT
jgi:hypothetical protein